MRISDYQDLFELSGLPFFVNDTLLKNYATHNVIFYFDGTNWKSFFPKSSLEKTLAEGLEFYGNNESFDQYEIDFEKYKKESSQLFERLIAQESLSEDDIAVFLENVMKLHSYYVKTEFFYSDRAFQDLEHNPVIKRNFEKLGTIKNSGREHLNKIFFGSESYLAKVFSTIAKQFNIALEQLNHYTHDEIKSLWQNKKVDEKHINDRSTAYLTISNNGETEIFTGQEALDRLKEFLSAPEEITELQGTIANKGKVQGIARVLNVGYDNFDQVVAEIEEMETGEILVAQTTSPELIRACHKASAIITNEGGMMSHAAIISRELNIPCIVAVRNATDHIKTGDRLEINADLGIIKVLKKGTL